MAEGRKRRKKTEAHGARCVLFGCSNTARDGFSIYTMPNSPVRVKRAWVKFINTPRANFKPSHFSKVRVCSGHFSLDQFDEGHLRMCQNGYRRNPPALKKHGVPSLKSAGTPPDFFSKPAQAAAAESFSRSWDTESIRSTAQQIRESMKAKIAKEKEEAKAKQDDLQYTILEPKLKGPLNEEMESGKRAVQPTALADHSDMERKYDQSSTSLMTTVTNIQPATEDWNESLSCPDKEADVQRDYHRLNGSSSRTPTNYPEEMPSTDQISIVVKEEFPSSPSDASCDESHDQTEMFTYFIKRAEEYNCNASDPTDVFGDDASSAEATKVTIKVETPSSCDGSETGSHDGSHDQIEEFTLKAAEVSSFSKEEEERKKKKESKQKQKRKKEKKNMKGEEKTKKKKMHKECSLTKLCSETMQYPQSSKSAPPSDSHDGIAFTPERETSSENNSSKKKPHIHTGDKPYLCIVCHDRFVQSKQLKSHMKIHTRGKQLYKGIMCSEDFALKEQIERHTRGHRGTKLNRQNAPESCPSVTKNSRTYNENDSVKMKNIEVEITNVNFVNISGRDIPFTKFEGHLYFSTQLLNTSRISGLSYQIIDHLLLQHSDNMGPPAFLLHSGKDRKWISKSAFLTLHDNYQVQYKRAKTALVIDAVRNARFAEPSTNSPSDETAQSDVHDAFMEDSCSLACICNVPIRLLARKGEVFVEFLKIADYVGLVGHIRMYGWKCIDELLKTYGMMVPSCFLSNVSNELDNREFISVGALEILLMRMRAGDLDKKREFLDGITKHIEDQELLGHPQ